MKRSFGILTIILILFGFVVPLALAGAIVCSIIAMVAAPEERRLDGKKKSGGLLGGVVDVIAMMGNTTLCPYCKAHLKRLQNAVIVENG